MSQDSGEQTMCSMALMARSQRVLSDRVDEIHDSEDSALPTYNTSCNFFGEDVN